VRGMVGKKSRTALTSGGIAPVGSYKYDYEILWMLPGNKSVSSGRQPNTSPVLSIDYEPPDAGA